MRNINLFTDWLQTDLTHFVAIAEEGSVVAGDPWQDGYSDHDLTIIVSQDVQSEMKAIYSFLAKYPLGNEYLVGLRIADEFAGGDSLNDISMKFRSKVIAGEDVVATKELPDRFEALRIGSEGLTNLTKRFERRWLNLSQWSDDYARKKNYEIYKNFFVFYAAYLYGKTGEYPTTRKEVASTLSDTNRANQLLNVTNNIGSSTKEKQKFAIEAALTLIPAILK
ncbi:MAG: hypothetical protein ACR2FM_01070 [Candidatus Saccharimonadales bacterium]